MHSPTMPTVSALFSGSVSVGLLAGVVSGLFYLVVAGIRWAGRLHKARERDRHRELRGQQRLEAEARQHGAGSGDDVLGGGDCDAPREVKQQSGEWLYRQVQRRLHPVPAAGGLRGSDDGVDMEPETVRVREFIERLVESLVSGELDNVCVKRLHMHPEYKRMADHDSPSVAHAALKNLVHQIIQEAMTLPKFKEVKPTEDDVKSLEDINSKTYEDILATAILNKVIERYQQSDSSGRATLDGNSNLFTPELMSLVALQQPKFLGHTESGVSSDDGRFFTNDGDSLSELSNTDPLSVTIEECIEEVTTFSNAEEEDDGDDTDSYLPGLDVFKNRRAPFPEYGRDVVDGPPLDLSDDEETSEEASIQPTDIVNPVDSWEENWLFQKRRLKVGGVSQPLSVPMLVPNPSEDYRALIGDRDAEDVSDLSDCSDGALEDTVLSENITAESTAVGYISTSTVVDTREEKVKIHSLDNNLIQLPHGNAKIENENKVHIGRGGLYTTDSVVPNVNKEFSNYKEELAEAKNLEYLKSTPEDCLSEFGQQEGEYTEDYAAVTRRQMDSLTGMSDPDTVDVPDLPSTPIPHLNPEISTVDGSVVAILEGLVPGESDTDQLSPTPLVNTELAKPPRPGTIAEREHKKWETAPPLPNNPYSPENIIKRLNKKSNHNRLDSNSDASVEFPKLQEVAVGEKVMEPPLQVICSPSDVDYKRYARDYYINAHSVTNSKMKQSSSSPCQQQEWVKENEVPATFTTSEPTKDADLTEIRDSNDIEAKVALWQKEINEADQYYKNILNKKQEQVQDSSSDEYNNQTDSSMFYKPVINNGNEDHDNNENKSERPKNKNRLRDKLKEIEETERNNTVTDKGKAFPFTQSKYEHKTNKENNLEAYEMLRRSCNMGSSFSINDNGNDCYTNELSRSDSPSGSSVLTSDSDFSMPSVKELTKRFSGLVDSDSSTSTPKSVSPAPQWKKKEEQLKQKDKEVAKEDSHPNLSSLSPPRPVREIHSLTARSISKEFREELRHNQPVPLNKNVYKQINPKHVKVEENGITEENSILSNTSPSPEPRSPIPVHSMQSSIAFWEQMQKNKS